MSTSKVMGDGMVAQWARSMERRNLSDGTVEKRVSVMRRLLEHAEQPDPTAITVAQIEAFLDRPISPRTRYTDISHIAAFYRWAIREELTEADPTARIDRPKVRAGLPRPIDTSDLTLALDQAATDPRLSAILHLAAFGGLRCAEIAHLRSEDIRGDMMLVHGKGGKERIIPVHPLIHDALRRLGLPAYGPVFDMPAWKVSHTIRRHLTDCGIRASAHQLRHWFGTAAYEASGGDLRMVQELLGHSSPTTTAIYTKWARGRSVDVVTSMTA